MTSSMTRAGMRRLLPRFLWVGARRTVTVVRRLLLWRAVLSEIKGVTNTDRTIMRQSFRRGVMAILHDLDTWRIPELLADARVTVAGVGEFDVRACSDDLFAILPAREAPVAAMLRKRLRPGAIFVDAGANIGLFTVLGSRLVGNGGRVFAIEMMPETASRLRRHVDANDLTNVTVFQSALSNRSGDSVRAFVPESKFGQASIVRHGLLGDEWQVTVQTQTLDDLLADTCGTIDLMKMDLEGAEAMALRGAKEMLKRTRAVIFEELPGESRAAELLQECGFTLRPLDPTNRIAERTR